MKTTTKMVKVLGTKLPIMEAKKFPSTWFSQESKAEPSAKRRKTNIENNDMDNFNTLMMMNPWNKYAELDASR